MYLYLLICPFIQGNGFNFANMSPKRSVQTAATNTQENTDIPRRPARS